MQDAWTGGRKPEGQGRETRSAGSAGADALSTGNGGATAAFSTSTTATGLDGQTDGQTAGGMRDQARGKASELKQQAKGKKDELRSQAMEKKDELKDRAMNAAEGRKGGLAEHVSALASALEAAASRLEESDEGRLAQYGRDASGRVQRMAGYLRDSDMRGLTRDLEDTAREHPRAFIASSLAAGLAAGRFLRSSRPEPGQGGAGYDAANDVGAADLSITEPPRTAAGTADTSRAASTPAGSGVSEPDISAARPRTGSSAMAARAAGSADATERGTESSVRGNASRQNQNTRDQARRTEGGNR